MESRRRQLLIGVLIAAASFALGAVVTRCGREAAAPAAAVAVEPRVFIDTSQVSLLPDAALRLDPPVAPDAGSAP